MTASELLNHVRRQGVKLWVDSGQVRYRAPKGVLTEVLREQLAAHRNEILELLRAPRGGPAADDTSIPRAPRTGGLPLSFIQERLWFIDRFEGGTDAYNIPFCARITVANGRSMVPGFVSLPSGAT